MILPQIHLNGSSPVSLEKEYMDAYDKLYEAIESFNKIGFHARDYYVIGDQAFEDARKSRNDHREKLNNALEYLEEHIIHIQKNQ